jgi:hypothetical protein
MWVVGRTFQEWPTHFNLKTKKCQLFHEEMRYLGRHVAGISDHGPWEAECCTAVATAKIQTWM